MGHPIHWMLNNIIEENSFQFLELPIHLLLNNIIENSLQFMEHPTHWLLNNAILNSLQILCEIAVQMLKQGRNQDKWPSISE